MSSLALLACLLPVPFIGSEQIACFAQVQRTEARKEGANKIENQNKTSGENCLSRSSPLSLRISPAVELCCRVNISIWINRHSMLTQASGIELRAIFVNLF